VPDHRLTTEIVTKPDRTQWWQSACSCGEYQSAPRVRYDHAMADGREHVSRYPASILPGIDLYTVAEVAQAARVSKMTVYRLIHLGGESGLPSVRIGKSYRVPREGVDKLLSGGCHGA